MKRSGQWVDYLLVAALVVSALRGDTAFAVAFATFLIIDAIERKR